MTKRTLAFVSVIFVLMIAMAGSATVPTVASTVPSVSAPTAPDLSLPTDTGWGSCRWYCGSKSYSTAAQCAAHCSVPCEDIC